MSNQTNIFSFNLRIQNRIRNHEADEKIVDGESDKILIVYDSNPKELIRKTKIRRTGL